MQTTINSFLADLSKNPRWNQFKSEVRKKLNAELTKLKQSVGQSKWDSAEKSYNQIVKKLTNAQKQMDAEVQKTLKAIKKSAGDVEKTLNQYKAIALKQKAQAKKASPAKRPSSAKKTAKKATAKRKTAKS